MTSNGLVGTLGKLESLGFSEGDHVGLRRGEREQRGRTVKGRLSGQAA